MSAAIAAAFEAALRRQGAGKTHEDVVREYAALKEDAPVTQIAQLDEIKFYSDFASSPAEANRLADEARRQAEQTLGAKFVQSVMRSNRHHELKKHRQNDFRLNDEETARLKALGFVVSERLKAESFAEIYYRLYSDDMPVFVTSDSVLHAWHRSFDAFLKELEEEELMPMLSEILDKMVSECRAQCSSSPSGDLKQALVDADFLLTMAQSLLSGEEPSAATAVSDNLSRLTATWTAIEAEELTSIEVFDTREVDFSMFKPRGHYTRSNALKQYFRAMTWLGTIDLRIDGTDDKPSELRQVQCALLLVHLLREANVLDKVSALHTIISIMTGDGAGSDNMTPYQLHNLLGEQDILGTYFGAANAKSSLERLQQEIANRGLGAQAIAGHPTTESSAAFQSPTTPTRLATSFAFLGQQFVWSAFVFSKLVYDQVLHEQTKVVRRIPGALDALFALFGNNAAGEEIAKRMAAISNEEYPDFVRFRDGVPYASNLLALRQLIDENMSKADPATCSLALLWQLALRELSKASANGDPVFQSKAWQARVMNTQLASFAQLRHDTILYAKQSFSMGTRCEYAAGFVEPCPSFWARMQQLGEKTLDIVARLKLLSGKANAVNDEDNESPLQYKARYFFENFVDVTRKLTEISIAQSLKRSLDEEQDDFLQSVIEERHGSGASRYLGWYPSLFYTHREDSGKQDRLVADIHTDVPSAEHGDPGGVLHVGVGDVNMGFFVVDRVMYAGPVFSSYEFVTPINERLNDDEFSETLDEMKAPSWARGSFLV